MYIICGWIVSATASWVFCQWLDSKAAVLVATWVVSWETKHRPHRPQKKRVASMNSMHEKAPACNVLLLPDREKKRYMAALSLLNQVWAAVSLWIFEHATVSLESALVAAGFTIPRWFNQSLRKVNLTIPWPSQTAMLCTWYSSAWFG